MSEKRVNDLTHDIFEAIRTRDRATLEAILAPEFIQVDAGGRVTDRQTFIDLIANAEYEIDHIHAAALTIHTAGPVVIATGIQAAAVRLPDGQTLMSRGSFSDVFVERDGDMTLIYAAGTSLDDLPRGPE
ncbi:MAG: nuclear transport factor 2 family protein [Vicinamibacterales bacterium]